VWKSPVFAVQSGWGPVGELCTVAMVNRGVLWMDGSGVRSSPVSPLFVHSPVHRVCIEMIFVTWATIVARRIGRSTIGSHYGHGQRPFDRMRLCSSVTWL
jgi:hypothetical protein